LDVLAAVAVGDEVESVSELLASAALVRISELFVEASVALLEVSAGSIDVVLGLAVSALCDVVGAFWKTEAAVVAVSSEKLFLLEPEDDDLELAEFSHAEFVHWSKSEPFASLEVHDQLVDLVNGSSGDISEDFGVEVSSFFSRKGVSNISSGSAESNFAGKSSDSQKVEKLHFLLLIVAAV